jgi:hypothetical protein
MTRGGVGGGGRMRKIDVARHPTPIPSPSRGGEARVTWVAISLQSAHHNQAAGALAGAANRDTFLRRKATGSEQSGPSILTPREASR